MRMAYLGFIAGCVFGMVLIACSTTNPFPYNYYGVDLKDQKLLGPTSGAYPDLPLEVCDPTQTSFAPCMAMLSTTLEQLKSNYENIQNELIECQKKVASQ